MTHQEIISSIERFAPLHYQESYDNAGWQCGRSTSESKGALVTLDVTEAVVDEAIAGGYNLIISHHPVLFPHIRSVTEKSWTGRLLLKAIEQQISIYTAHTNLDNMSLGVNRKICDKLDLIDTAVLSPMGDSLYKYAVHVPDASRDKVLEAIFEAGGGVISAYSECSFSLQGVGTFRPSADADPAIGKAGGPRESVEEQKIEVLVPSHMIGKIIQAVSAIHPYEEVAYDIIPLKNKHQNIGAGFTGYLADPMDIGTFLRHIRDNLNTNTVKYTHAATQDIRKVAVCGGSGAFLTGAALQAGCDAYITSDIKYHQFFDVENQMTLIDIGHYESEQFTPEIFYDIIKKNFPNFAVGISKINTNPVKYFS